MKQELSNSLKTMNRDQLSEYIVAAMYTLAKKEFFKKHTFKRIDIKKTTERNPLEL